MRPYRKHRSVGIHIRVSMNKKKKGICVVVVAKIDEPSQMKQWSINICIKSDM